MKRKFGCPGCKTRSITLKQKYSTGLWRIIKCPNCGRHLTAVPLLLALLAVLHVWNIAWFVLWSYYKGNALWLLCIPPIWALIDLINLRFIPLALLKRSPG